MQARHGCNDGIEQPQEQTVDLSSKRRQKERLKTTAVALVLCLNIGVDPPDVIKISPCARLECWVDPLSMQGPKALDTIGQSPYAVMTVPGLVSKLVARHDKQSKAMGMTFGGWQIVKSFGH